MTTPITLEEIARNALDGDRDALDALVRALQGDIYGLALRMLWNREDAEDATQEILIRIVTHLSQFSFKSRLKTWAYRVAVNYVLDVKKSAIERLHLSFERFADDLDRGLEARSAADTEQSLLIEEVKVGCSMAMLQCLDRPHRAAYVLGEIMELSGPEAAEVLEILAGTLPEAPAARARGRADVHHVTLRPRVRQCAVPVPSPGPGGGIGCRAGETDTVRAPADVVRGGAASGASGRRGALGRAASSLLRAGLVDRLRPASAGGDRPVPGPDTMTTVIGATWPPPVEDQSPACRSPVDRAVRLNRGDCPRRWGRIGVDSVLPTAYRILMLSGPRATRWTAPTLASRSTWRRASTASSPARTGASTGSRPRTSSSEGDTMDPGFVEAFLKTIDCYVMGSRTYETALDFEAKRVRVGVRRQTDLRPHESRAAASPGHRRVLLGRPRAVRQWAPAARVPQHLVRWRRCRLRRVPSSRAGRRNSLFDPADPDRRRDPVLRERSTATSPFIWRRSTPTGTAPWSFDTKCGEDRRSEAHVDDHRGSRCGSQLQVVPVALRPAGDASCPRRLRPDQ